MPVTVASPITSRARDPGLPTSPGRGPILPEQKPGGTASNVPAGRGDYPEPSQRTTPLPAQWNGISQAPAIDLVAGRGLSPMRQPDEFDPVTGSPLPTIGDQDEDDQAFGLARP